MSDEDVTETTESTQNTDTAEDDNQEKLSNPNDDTQSKAEGSENDELDEIEDEDEFIQEEYDEDDDKSMAEKFYDEVENDKNAQLISEYMKLMMAVDSQRRIINDIKNEVCKKYQKDSRIQTDDKGLRNLQCCLERENLKLQCLIRKATEIQQIDPTQPWSAIQIATTFEEDELPLNIKDMIAANCEKFSKDDRKKSDSHQKPCTSSVPENELEKFIGCLLHQTENLHQNKKHQKMPKSKMQDENPLAQQILSMLCNMNSKAQSDRGRPKRVGKELNRNYNMQEKLMTDNSCLERNRFKLQEELLHRDRIIDCLQQKNQLLQSEICKRRRGKFKDISQNLFSHSNQIMPELKNVTTKSENLEKGVNKLQLSVERLKVEMDCLRKERDQWDNQSSSSDKMNFNLSPTSKCAQVKSLKESYQQLLCNYAKINNELKHLREKANNFAKNKNDNELKMNNECNEDVENAEFELLHEKFNDLIEEKEEFKFLLKEQEQQLEEVRCRYLVTQQKVEEQKCILEKTDISSKKIEEQIASEIKRITVRFQQKCTELMKFPKLLEQEQLKLANCVREKDEVKQKLNIVCKEYTMLKRQYDNNADGPENTDWRTKAIKTEQEYYVMKENCDALRKDKSIINETLLKAKNDYNCLVEESNRILARTRERALQQKNALAEHTNKLEKELAQSRACGFLNVTDREEFIKELQGQISALCFSFDAAKEQISNLKSQISSLTDITA